MFGFHVSTESGTDDVTRDGEDWRDTVRRLTPIGDDTVLLAHGTAVVAYHTERQHEGCSGHYVATLRALRPVRRTDDVRDMYRQNWRVWTEDGRTATVAESWTSGPAWLEDVWVRLSNGDVRRPYGLRVLEDARAIA